MATIRLQVAQVPCAAVAYYSTRAQQTASIVEMSTEYWFLAVLASPTMEAAQHPTMHMNALLERVRAALEERMCRRVRRQRAAP